MVANSSRAQCPRGFARSGTWPHADLADHHAACVAQALARRLAAAMEQRDLSANRLAVAAGINRQTIANVLAGTGWPDLLTIASLEQALDTDLWPGLRP
ncbi:helix-turn-helix transcriptional regulator [Streptomyces sp. NPDC020667]|uniref:helix-turn-helix domain-containing protein n=1 Tax=Streptomyces sp. NPDC020667 TaxID=3154895 RepID=UPI0033ED0CA1